MRPEEVRYHLNEIVYYTNKRLYMEREPYIFTAAIYKKDPETGRCYYQAELTDPKTKKIVSVLKPGLEEIESDK